MRDGTRIFCNGKQCTWDSNLEVMVIEVKDSGRPCTITEGCSGIMSARLTAQNRLLFNCATCGKHKFFGNTAALLKDDSVDSVQEVSETEEQS